MSLEGGVQKKCEIIQRFQNDDSVGVFLIPMKTGASGLTLTAAKYAFIMEPNLNPGLEHQAISRMHRIGQAHPVTVYRFVVENTVEERVLALQRSKSSSFVSSTALLTYKYVELLDEETISFILSDEKST